MRYDLHSILSREIERIDSKIADLSTERGAIMRVIGLIESDPEQVRTLKGEPSERSSTGHANPRPVLPKSPALALEREPEAQPEEGVWDVVEAFKKLARERGNGGLFPSPSSLRAAAPPANRWEMVKILLMEKGGMTTHQTAFEIRERFCVKIEKGSLSAQLSTWKRKGLLVLDDGKWRLNKDLRSI